MAMQRTSEENIISRIKNLEQRIDQNQLTQRNAANRQQLTLDAVLRLEDLLLSGRPVHVVAEPLEHTPTRLANLGNQADMHPSAAEVEVKAQAAGHLSPVPEAEQKAEKAVPRQASADEVARPELLKAMSQQLTGQYSEIDAVVRALQEEIQRANKHIHCMEQSMASQTTEMATSHKVLLEEMTKLQAQAAQAASAARASRRTSVSNELQSIEGSPRDGFSASSLPGDEALRGQDGELMSDGGGASPMSAFSPDRRSARRSKTGALNSIPSFEQAKTMMPDQTLASVDEAASHPEYIVRLANSTAFNTVASLLIIFNMVFIGVEAGMKVSYAFDKIEGIEPLSEDQLPQTLNTVFLVLEYTFLSWMGLEFIINMTASFRNNWQCFWWNVFDGVILASSLMQIFQSNINLSFLRLGKLYRLVRVLRVGKVLQALKAFSWLNGVRKMVLSVAGSLTSLFWALMLIIVIMYVVSIIFLQGVQNYLDDHIEQVLASPAVANTNATTTLAPGAAARRMSLFYMEGDLEGKEATLYGLRIWYGGMGKTMLTLFRTISGGAEWGEVAEPVNNVHWIYLGLWVVFIGFMIFGVLNVLTGVFCDAALKAASDDREMAMQEMLTEQRHIMDSLRTVFLRCDEDQSGQVSAQEFEAVIDLPEVQGSLATLGLEASEAKGLFCLLDEDESGVIGIDEFVAGCMRLKGGAKSVDMVTLLFENRKLKARVAQLAENVDTILNEVKAGQKMLEERMSKVRRTHVH